MDTSDTQRVGQRQTAVSVPIEVGDESAESRWDPITGDWTIFAPDRDRRPDEFAPVGESVKKNLQCPFCAGNESNTPAAVWTGRIANGICEPNVADPECEDWDIRVVPNRYPAVTHLPPQDSAPLTAATLTSATPTSATRNGPSGPQPATAASELFQSGPIRGGHEVIVESRRHTASLSGLDLAEVTLTLLAYRDRIRHWRSVSDVAYISTFKNVGEKAGASLRHSHSQLIATDQMPAAVSTVADRMRRHHATTGRCLQCDLTVGEIRADRRVVWKGDSVIAFCPFAGRLPMMLRITTMDHQPCFEDLDEPLIESVSQLLHRAVSWLEWIRPDTAYNYYLSTRPPGLLDPSGSFHWSLDLFPRMTQVAGFEWSSGCMINSVLPEQAAAKYREAAGAEDLRPPSR